MQKERSQFHACLPTTGEFTDRTVEVFSFQFELAANFAAFPVRLAAVSHHEFEGSFAWQKRVVLAQVADVELRMLDD